MNILEEGLNGAYLSWAPGLTSMVDVNVFNLICQLYFEYGLDCNFW